MPSMRQSINLVEHALTEVDRVGILPDDDFYDDMHKKDYSSDQLDLFREIPSLGPNVPDDFSVVGRLGEMFVAEKKDGDYRIFVFFDKGTAAAHISLAPWDIKRLNYRSTNAYEPDLHGVGLRVGAVMVQKDYRGQGLGPKMYQWVLEHVCDYIISDEGHTHAGEALWKRLAGMKSIFAVEVWDGLRYKSRARKRGKDWDQIYNTMHLIPWVTLRSRLDTVLGYDD